MQPKAHTMTQPRPALPLQVLDALQRGQVVEAIKLMRQQQGLGLKEAKEMVDAARQHLVATPGATSRPSATPRPAPPETPPQPLNGRAPGEEPQHSHAVDAVLLLAAALAVCWYFWR